MRKRVKKEVKLTPSKLAWARNVADKYENGEYVISPMTCERCKKTSKDVCKQLWAGNWVVLCDNCMSLNMGQFSNYWGFKIKCVKWLTKNHPKGSVTTVGTMSGKHINMYNVNDTEIYIVKCSLGTAFALTHDNAMSMIKGMIDEYLED